MANDRFPNWLFGPKHQPYPSGGALSGGQLDSGPPQTADMATGGTWPTVACPPAAGQTRRAYRAKAVATMATGVNVMDIPVVRCPVTLARGRPAGARAALRQDAV